MMSERHWLTCSDPRRLLAYLRANHVNRTKRGRKRLRVFGVGCARRVRQHMSERGRTWLDLSQQWCAEDPMTNPLRRQEFSQDSWLNEPRTGSHREAADFAAWFTLSPNAMESAAVPAHNAAMVMGILGTQTGRGGDDYLAERTEQTKILRDLFGNPFRPALDEDWKTPNVVALTRAAYDHCIMPGEILEPERLAVLADALEEAGCTNAVVLAQCRGSRPLVRDCWFVDALLDLC